LCYCNIENHEDGDFYYSYWKDGDEFVLWENRKGALETIATNTAYNEQPLLDAGIPGPKEMFEECTKMAQKFMIPSNART
jgi:hypothetical protein